MDRRHYLSRIGYHSPAGPNVETLRDLHRHHLLHVPFENLDIHRGQPIVLEAPALFDKIVRRRRGGFCYELNGLFAWLLRDLGFEVDLLSARPVGDDGLPGPEFDHMALLVQLEERWLVDVGFGESFTEPVAIDSRRPPFASAAGYRVTPAAPSDLALERHRPGQGWTRQYLFSTRSHQIEEYRERCVYHQTSPESHFTRKRLCTVATTEGRVTLSDLRLIESSPGRRKVTDLADDDEWRRTLKELFAVELS